MTRALLATVTLVLVVSGCGSGSGETSGSTGVASPSSSPSASASATYFVAADSTEINKPTAAAQQAGALALKDANIDRCNKLTKRGVVPYRRCLRGLLNPYETALGEVAATFEKLAARDFPARCRAELSRAAMTFTRFAGRVDTLMQGFEDDRRAAQAKSARTFVKVIRAIESGYNKPFQDMTQVCYSPKDLESINASPSASPSS